jgi:hypothetical protein
MELEDVGPGAVGAAHGAKGLAFEEAHRSTEPHAAREALTARVLPDGEPVTVFGREAKTLRLLITVGPRGFTSSEAAPLGWARRVSHYIFMLRRAGFSVVTARERTTDGALVARYSLEGQVQTVAERSVTAETVARCDPATSEGTADPAAFACAGAAGQLSEGDAAPV